MSLKGSEWIFLVLKLVIMVCVFGELVFWVEFINRKFLRRIFISVIDELNRMLSDINVYFLRVLRLFLRWMI